MISRVIATKDCSYSPPQALFKFSSNPPKVFLLVQVMASSSNHQMTSRQRQLLPLGVPPSQTTFGTSSQPNEQRTALRVNRACNTCRRQKMRCEGDPGSACLRCQNSGIECVFEKVPTIKPPVVTAANRLSSLEEKVELLQSTQIQMQQSLQQILNELKAFSGILKEHDGPSPKRRRYAVSEPTMESKHIDDALNRPYNMSDDNLRPIASSLKLSPELSTSNVEVPNLIKIKNYATSSSISSEFHIPRAQSAHFLTTSTPNTSNSSPEPAIITKFGDEISQIFQQNNIKRLDARSVIREDNCRRYSQDQAEHFHILDASYPDPIDRKLITVYEARSLFDLFFEKCFPRLPIFDPRIDTFQSLRQRSVFCFCCILMVASRARDGASPTALQNTLWNEAMARAKVSMFHPVTNLEVIQSLPLGANRQGVPAGFSLVIGYIGHAIRCAVEMGIHKALTRLAVSSPETSEAEKNQILVSSARVWCALFAFEHQLSFGIGRHTMTGHPRSIKNARDILLRHPLSQLSDMRLVFSCEIMILEYQLLETLPTADADDPRCQGHLQEARTRMDQWFSEWEIILGEHYPVEHYMRQTLKIHKEYGFMTLHMAGMPRIITSEDLDNASPNEKLNCVYAVSAAKEVARISVDEPSYRDGLRYSPTCFYSGVSFVGALLLRLGVGILKDEEETINQYTVKLFHVLLDAPTCRFKFQFVSLLKAKELIPQDSPGDQEPMVDSEN